MARAHRSHIFHFFHSFFTARRCSLIQTLLRLASAGTEKNSWGESLSVASPWTCCFVLKKIEKQNSLQLQGTWLRTDAHVFIDLFIHIMEQQYHHCMLKLNQIMYSLSPLLRIFCMGLMVERLQGMFMTSTLPSLQSFYFLLRGTWAKCGPLFSHSDELLCVCSRRVVQYRGNIHVLCGEELLERFLRRNLQCLHLQSAGCVEQRWRWDGLINCCCLWWWKVQVPLDLWPFFCIFILPAKSLQRSPSMQNSFYQYIIRIVCL